MNTPREESMQIEVFQSDLDGSGLRVGVVQARFNQSIGEALRDACLGELGELGVAAEDVFVCTVPGALEIPVVLQQLAASGEFDALIALGAVVRGETYHFEVVSNESAAGISRVALDFNVPIANAVLTTENDEQAAERAAEKGAEAARVAVEMANLASSLSALGDDEYDEDEEDDDEEEDEDDEEEDGEEEEDETDEESRRRARRPGRPGGRHG
ncbi:MAG: 6,7-dimethyl-8-ribityllumazine synthase [Burkholderiales bacterium 70-64]|nr:MAG: 6,7-dimethyl-8-ribityllumazine synthase [Burkholderiales bacterium 70-64]